MPVARFALAALAAAACFAAEPLVYQGKPLRLPFECSEEEVQAFGLDCTHEEPCPVFLELTGMESAGSKIFLTGNLHTATVTLYSILLASEDEGKTWTEPHERIRSTGLDQVQFLDFERGWIAGHQLQTLPRDPFFLLTTDGGKTWRRRPVFGESQVGSIEQFWFDSRTDGVAIVDRRQSTETGARYSIYETRTGGDTWMVREVGGKAPRLKRAAGQNPDRRVRADARSKAFVVERREGEGWRVLAAFFIDAGACRPAPLKAIQPPPESPPPEATKPEAPAATPRGRPTLKKK